MNYTRTRDRNSSAAALLRQVAALILLALPLRCVAVNAWQPIVSPQDRIYPALVLATQGRSTPPASTRVFGEGDGLIGARMRATRAGEHVRLRISSNGWIEPAALDAILPEAGVEYELYPRLEWNRAALLQAPGDQRIVLQFTLESSRGPARRTTRSVRVHAINEAPYFVRHADGGVDFSWIFAAYVDEAHPMIDALLAEALASGVVERFDGYAGGDPEHVYRQVYAIWFALQQRGIRYSRVTPSSAASESVRSQRVRFIEQSLADARSNCVDGSVLIASALRRIGIAPTLVLIPQHMFLAFDLDARGSARAYLETTLLGDAVTPGRHTTDARSFASFEAAVERGFAEFSAAEAKLADPAAGAYLLVPIARARALGVEPISRHEDTP